MNLRKKITGLWCLAAPYIFLVSCTGLPLRDAAAAVYDRRALGELKNAPLVLGEIVVQYADELAEFSYPLGEIIKPMALGYGYSIQTAEDGKDRAEKGYALDIWIKEESFFKGLDFLVSTAGTFRIREEGRNRVIFAMTFVEESKETVRSFRSLYRILNTFFERMDHESGKRTSKD